MSWEERIAKYLRGRSSEQLRDLLAQFLPELTEPQYRAVLAAVRDDGARRGLVAPRVGAGREAPR